MANTIAHSSIAFLALIFPDKLSFWPLLIASNFADIDYFYPSVKKFLKGSKKDIFLSKTNILHSLIGTFIFGFPLIYLFFSINGITAKILIFSIFFGLASHLILDIPAHNELFLFWPIKVYKSNKLTISTKSEFIRKLYAKSPYISEDKVKDEHLPNFTWLVLSSMVCVIIILIYLIKHLLFS